MPNTSRLLPDIYHAWMSEYFDPSHVSVASFCLISEVQNFPFFNPYRHRVNGKDEFKGFKLIDMIIARSFYFIFYLGVKAKSSLQINVKFFIIRVYVASVHFWSCCLGCSLQVSYVEYDYYLWNVFIMEFKRDQV